MPDERSRSAIPAKPVMTDVARLAGVSQKTVSRVVNDEPNVSDAARARVLEAIEVLGYRRNAAARALVTNRTQIIGIVTLGTALYGPSAQLFGLERAAWDAGYSVVVASTVDVTAREMQRAVHQLLDHGVDGIVVGGAAAVTGAPSDLPSGVPAVAVGEPFGADHPCPAVVPDQEGGARAATQHLLSFGHETVLHLAGPDTWPSATARRAGWRQTLEAAGVAVLEPIPGDWSAAAGYEAGRQLASRRDVTAVFAANDQMALGFMRAVYERGRRIPDDISVVGFDDQPESAYCLIPLTTVRQDFAAIARHAIDELVGMINGTPATAGVTRLPVDLVARASSGPAPTQMTPPVGTEGSPA